MMRENACPQVLTTHRLCKRLDAIVGPLGVSASLGADFAEVVHAAKARDVDAETIGVLVAGVLDKLSRAADAGKAADVDALRDAVEDAKEILAGALQALRSGETTMKSKHDPLAVLDLSAEVTKAMHDEQDVDSLAEFLRRTPVKHREVQSRLVYLRATDLSAAVDLEKAMRAAGVEVPP
ncbi:MAG: hypothetical protein RIF41_34120 [Polyangiaceae bacterium]